MKVARLAMKIRIPRDETNLAVSMNLASEVSECLWQAWQDILLYKLVVAGKGDIALDAEMFLFPTFPLPQGSPSFLRLARSARPLDSSTSCDDCFAKSGPKT